jgi:hypothetical protein
MMVPSFDQMFDYILNRTNDGRASALFQKCADIIGNPFYTDNTRWVLLQQILESEEAENEVKHYH